MAAQTSAGAERRRHGDRHQARADELSSWALDYETGKAARRGAMCARPRWKHPRRLFPVPGRPSPTRKGIARFSRDRPPEVRSHWAPYGDHLVRMEEGGRFGVASTWWDTGADPWDLGASSYFPRARRARSTRIGRSTARARPSTSRASCARRMTRRTRCPGRIRTTLTVVVRVPDSADNELHSSPRELESSELRDGREARSCSRPDGADGHRYDVHRCRWDHRATRRRPVAGDASVHRGRVPHARSSRWRSRRTPRTTSPATASAPEARADFYFGGAVSDATVT